MPSPLWVAPELQCGVRSSPTPAVSSVRAASQMPASYGRLRKCSCVTWSKGLAWRGLDVVEVCAGVRERILGLPNGHLFSSSKLRRMEDRPVRWLPNAIILVQRFPGWGSYAGILTSSAMIECVYSCSPEHLPLSPVFILTVPREEGYDCYTHCTDGTEAQRV